MITKKLYLSIIGFLAFGLSSLSAAEIKWVTDFEEAKTIAAKEGKSLLINFTGSDWCGWCIRLDKEVFDTDTFAEGVKDKFVLVKLDFPKDKSDMTEGTITQNEKLQAEYMVQGFPSILLTDEKGRPFAKTGYQQGGPESYLASLDTLLGIRKDRDSALKISGEQEGDLKAEADLGVLKVLQIDDALITKFYSDQIEHIKEVEHAEGMEFIQQLENTEKFADFQRELQQMGTLGDHAAALKFVESTLEADTFSGERKQQIFVIKGIILAELGQFDESLMTIDLAKAIAPESEITGRIDQMKDQIEMLKKQKSGANTK